LTAKAHAVVVPDAVMPQDDRRLMRDQLQAAGFGEVTMLSKPAQPANAVEPAPSVAAA
jgi:polysaccharide biosynthesis transport protein